MHVEESEWCTEAIGGPGEARALCRVGRSCEGFSSGEKGGV